MTQADVSAQADAAGGVREIPGPAGEAAEAIEALTALGYSAAEARDAVSRVKDQSDRAEELIRLALRNMATQI